MVVIFTPPRLSIPSPIGFSKHWIKLCRESVRLYVFRENGMLKILCWQITLSWLVFSLNKRENKIVPPCKKYNDNLKRHIQYMLSTYMLPSLQLKIYINSCLQNKPWGLLKAKFTGYLPRFVLWDTGRPQLCCWDVRLTPRLGILAAPGIGGGLHQDFSNFSREKPDSHRAPSMWGCPNCQVLVLSISNCSPGILTFYWT